MERRVYLEVYLGEKDVPRMHLGEKGVSERERCT